MAVKNKFEGVQNTSEKYNYFLRLYITGATPNSVRALTNIKKILEEKVKGQYKLEIVDVYQQQSVAESEQLIALPLLVRKYPMPERRLIGDLSNIEKVLKVLELQNNGER